ncbi:MAG: DNA recombination protein RmuC [Syntrophaceae bacterium]|nr:DNA recombination protein RmuC [Syntrophaceae bacterium]
MDLILIIIIIVVMLAGFVLLFWRVGCNVTDFAPLANKIDNLRDLQERTERSVRDEIARLRLESQTQAQQERAEITQSIEKVRTVVDEKLKSIQEDNSKQLERMRETVDEKLHNTLETRLGEAFKLVSERLEQVQKGLGEMQNLATGVGDLKKVLMNVKTKGVLGEYQLGGILEQILTPAQYERNIKTKEGSNDVVEYAVKIPSKEDSSRNIWLPLDAKFPTEDYTRLINAYETGDVAEIETGIKSLKTRIEKFAREIQSKYIDPPNTTDFAIMFLPFEGLFAEVLRIPGLFENIQRNYRVTVTGPTTISAFLSSLQMGFRTLAIQKHSGEVWRVLGEVKTAFGKFGETLEMVRKRLEQATSSVDDAQKKTKTISSKLNAVEAMPDESPSEKVLADD